MRTDQSTAEPGDRARIVITESRRAEAEETLRALRADRDLAELLVPSPVTTDVRDHTFGDLSVAQEFLVAAGAGISTEALIAAVRAAVERKRSRRALPDDEPVERGHLVVTGGPLGEGVIEITITVTRTDRR